MYKASPGMVQKIEDLLASLDSGPTLAEIAGFQGEPLQAVNSIIADGADPIPTDWLKQFRQALLDSSRQASARIQLLEQIAQQCQDFADMDFSFLFDKSRDLFSIGYNVGDRRLDGSFYDLLASEGAARAAS